MAYAGMLLITLKIFDNDNPKCHNVLWPGSLLSKFLIRSTAFLHRPWPPLLISHVLSGLSHHFFYSLGVFGWDFLHFL